MTAKEIRKFLELDAELRGKTVEELMRPMEEPIQELEKVIGRHRKSRSKRNKEWALDIRHQVSQVWMSLHIQALGCQVLLTRHIFVRAKRSVRDAVRALKSASSLNKAELRELIHYVQVRLDLICRLQTGDLAAANALVRTELTSSKSSS